MKIAFRFAARSDVGVRRSKNDDSGYGGRYLAVVADGMGGHVGGDVASATAVLNLTPLDHPDFDGTAGVYLADEIQSANSIINDLAHEDSRLAGMGTTCTALLIDGDKIELAHIGDSRAYRLRPGPDGQFEQISTDHTFVQRLLNEGRITPQEAVHHPHRNVIMRVLGDVDASPELELQTLDAVPGERWVLASDGLDSVVPDSDIEAVLRSTDDLEQIADVLIQMTLERGAPDNVTVVVAQVIDRSVLPEDEPVGESAVPDAPSLPASIAPAVPNATGDEDTMRIPPEDPTEVNPAGGDSPGSAHIRRRFRRARDLTGSLLHEEELHKRGAVEVIHTSAEILRGQLGQRPHQLVGSAASATETGMIPAVVDRTLEHRATLAQRVPLTTEGETAQLPEELEAMLTVDAAKHRPRRWPLRIFVLLLVVGVLSAAAWTGMRWISGRYYVSDSNGKVSIYNGIPQTLGPIRFSHVVEESNVSVNDLSDHNRALLKDTISADNIDEARVVVNRLQTQANLNAHPSPSPSPSSSASPSGSAKPSESHNPSATPTPTPSAEESGNATVPLMPGTEGAATTEGDVGTVTGEGGAHHG
ncbi:PP2C family protein-serine/threonine phosphatase [Rothia aeria]|uniref:PP2C family protein-serine/threonine phosphatase n=1 Tax=Rothia aeria TaxID=172042 RepID=UPI00361E9FB8